MLGKLWSRGAAVGTALGGAVVGTIAAVRPHSVPGRTARQLVDRLGSRVRYLEGVWRGARYRAAGGAPDPTVPDDVLADRVRSELGPLEKRLDVPRVHVTVHDHLVMVHGAVPDAAAADAIHDAVSGISGVEGVESYLHVGLTRGDTRPSEGRARDAESEALARLHEAAGHVGVRGSARSPAVQAVLAAFADRLPPGELEHVRSHLPADVRPLLRPPLRSGRVPRVRHVSGLVDVVARQAGLERSRAQELTVSILATLRELVPEEAADVAATLPAELRDLWLSAAPA